MNAGFGVGALLLEEREQVFGLGALAFEPEFEEIGGLYDAAEANIIGAVLLAGAALFDLFEVAQALARLALAESEGAVGKVEEHFAALQVVAGEGLCGVAFGGMGQHQQAEAVLLFEAAQVAHEQDGAGGGLGAGAQAGEVIDDDGARPGGDEQVFEVVGKGFKLVVAAGFGVQRDAVKAGRKAVGAISIITIPPAELFGAELEIEI